MITLASKYFQSQHLVGFYRQMASKLLVAEGSSESLQSPWTGVIPALLCVWNQHVTEKMSRQGVSFWLHSLRKWNPGFPEPHSLYWTLFWKGRNRVYWFFFFLSPNLLKFLNSMGLKHVLFVDPLLHFGEFICIMFSSIIWIKEYNNITRIGFRTRHFLNQKTVTSIIESILYGELKWINDPIIDLGESNMIWNTMIREEAATIRVPICERKW